MYAYYKKLLYLLSTTAILRECRILPGELRAFTSLYVASSRSPKQCHSATLRTPHNLKSQPISDYICKLTSNPKFLNIPRPAPPYDQVLNPQLPILKSLHSQISSPKLPQRQASTPRHLSYPYTSTPLNPRC